MTRNRIRFRTAPALSFCAGQFVSITVGFGHKFCLFLEEPLAAFGNHLSQRVIKLMPDYFDGESVRSL